LVVLRVFDAIEAPVHPHKAVLDNFFSVGLGAEHQSGQSHHAGVLVFM